MSARPAHVGAVFTVIIATFILVGSAWIVITTTLSLRRLIKVQNASAAARRGSAETRGTEAEEEELGKGGARKLRKILVISLMCSDGIIAFSSFGPAITGLSGIPLIGRECDPAGFLLAMGLWWQYGFSLVRLLPDIAEADHSDHHLYGTSPPSVRAQASGGEAVRMDHRACGTDRGGAGSGMAIYTWICGVARLLFLRISIFLRCRAFPVYTSTSSFTRPIPAHASCNAYTSLISSLIIAIIYLPLIHFLRRPDLSALYLSPRPASLAFPPSAPEIDVPPWERLSFPNFTGLGLTSLDDQDAKIISSFASVPATSGLGIAGFNLAAPFFPRPVPVSMSLAPSLTKPDAVYFPQKLGLGVDRSSMVSEMTLVPSLRVIIGTPSRKPSITSTRRGSSFRKSAKLSPSPTCLCRDGDDSPGSDEERDYASFRGMMDFVPCPTHGEGGVSIRPSTPTRESLASYMNRRTSSLLIWFPLTHLIICAITLARFIYFMAAEIDDSAIEGLSLISLLGQGFADVIVFGLIERRTQRRYRQQVEACTPRREATLEAAAAAA